MEGDGCCCCHGFSLNFPAVPSLLYPSIITFLCLVFKGLFLPGYVLSPSTKNYDLFSFGVAIHVFLSSPFPCSVFYLQSFFSQRLSVSKKGDCPLRDGWCSEGYYLLPPRSTYPVPALTSVSGGFCDGDSMRVVPYWA